MKRSNLFALLAAFMGHAAYPQVFSNREVNPNDLAGNDSLVSEVYPYVLPLLGKKAVAAGYDLPYSAGISLNYFTQASDIILEDLSVGFNPNYALE